MLRRLILRIRVASRRHSISGISNSCTIKLSELILIYHIIKKIIKWLLKWSINKPGIFLRFLINEKVYGNSILTKQQKNVTVH